MRCWHERCREDSGGSPATATATTTVTTMIAAEGVIGPARLKVRSVGLIGGRPKSAGFQRGHTRGIAFRFDKLCEYVLFAQLGDPVSDE
jgi:hypothetical protein